MNLNSTKKDYRQWLQNELERRCAKNPKYSLRSFARDLNLSPARLSDVLRGRYGFSRSAAEDIAKKLGLSPKESSHFCDLVESQHARDPKRKAAAQGRVSGASVHYQQLSLDGFQVVSDWYHYAILELSLIEGFQSQPRWIATRLGIQESLAKAAIERLLRLDLLQIENGKLEATDSFTASPDGIPSDAIKKFHRQILEKAIAAIDFQTVEERDLSSLVLAVDESQVGEAKEMIKTFRRSFDTKFGQAKRKTAVYCLATQFFRVQEKTGKTL